MQRATYWLFPLIALLVAVFIVVFLVQMNSSSTQNLGIEKSKEQNLSVHLGEDAPGWLTRLKLTKDSGYAYPINDVTLKIDGNKEHSSTEKYHLVVHLKDSYEFFSFKQEVKNTSFSYLLNQNGDAMSVVIDSNDAIGLKNLVTKLKTYQISATLSPFKED